MPQLRHNYKFWHIYQFWLAIGLFILPIFLGWGLPMVIPSSPNNGFIILILGVVLSSPFFLWTWVLYRKQGGAQVAPHNRRSKMITGLGVIAVIIGLVMIVSQLNFKSGTQSQTNPQSPNTTTTTVLGALPPFADGKQEFTLTAGMLVMRGTIADLMNGQPHNLNWSIDGSVYKLVSVYIKNRVIYIDTTLYGGDRAPSVKLTESVLVSEPQGWDVNADTNAIEIVDDRQNPVIQIIFKTYYQMVINGFLYYPGGFMFVDEDGRTIQNPKTPQDYSLQRIFKYPSVLYQGKRVTN